jgi:DNA-binding MarR family transcriptional regulator
MGDIKRLRDAVRYLREHVSPTVGLQFLIVFLEVAVNEGVTEHELIQLTGIGTGTISRNVNQVVHKYGLISTSYHATEYRRVACYLTPRGKKVRDDLLRILYK